MRRFCLLMAGSEKRFMVGLIGTRKLMLKLLGAAALVWPWGKPCRFEASVEARLV